MTALKIPQELLTNRKGLKKMPRPLIIKKEDVITSPFPHVIKDEFINPELYSRLRAEFPVSDVFGRNTSVGGRAGRDIYRGDEAYKDLLLNSPAWREFSEYINSMAYVDFVLEMFGEYFERFDCRISPKDASFADFIESRETLQEKSRMRRLAEQATEWVGRPTAPNQLFSRLDLAQGGVGYGKVVHCDRPNRLTSMIVYFSDAEKIELEGGELLLHEHLVQKPYHKYERHPKPDSVRTIGSIKPKENRGVFFLCTNNSYHSATPVQSQAAFRDFIYVSVSSRVSIW